MTDDFLPILIARVDGDHWVVTCPDCRQENRHSAAPGYRHSHCRCPGQQEPGRMEGYVIAPPGSRLAPYGDQCAKCISHFARVDDDPPRVRGRRLAAFTPVDLDPHSNGHQLVAAYVCDWSHGWERTWDERPVGWSRPQNEGPRRCALYRHFDADDILLYVGISESLIKRGKKHARHSRWVRYAARAEAVWLNSRQDAERAEREAILAEFPIFNLASAGPGARERADAYLHAHHLGERG